LHRSNSKEHIVFIDFLRGSAALLVAAFHSQIHGVWGYPGVEISPDSLTYRFIYGQFGVGVFAVALFFIVSGFLIPSTLERPTATVRDFAIRRFFRLYPLYWLSLAAMAVASPLVFHNPPIPIKQVLWNLTMLQGFAGVPDVIGVYWTLQIEVVFYILCALLFAVGFLKFRRSQIVLCALAALACGTLRHVSGRRLPVALFLALCLMFLGNLLRHASRERSGLRSYWLFAGLVAGVVWPVCWLSYDERWKMYLLSYWAALGVFTASYLARDVF
jgi:peptidoglycan/LPS O-acetylase OafA/YrhL